MNGERARYRSHNVRVGATIASKALKIFGVLGKAIARVVHCIMAALERHWKAFPRRAMDLSSTRQSLFL